MSLPNPGMSFTPFAVLPASELNDIVENIEALADGTGFDAGAVGPEDRSGGYYIGTISGATLGTTGVKAITGVGFTPKMVRFSMLPSVSSNSIVGNGYGAMTAAAQYTVMWAGTSASATWARNSYTTACIGWTQITTTTPSLLAAYSSMDADGFSINVINAANTFPVMFEAYA